MQEDDALGSIAVAMELYRLLSDDAKKNLKIDSPSARIVETWNFEDSIESFFINMRIHTSLIQKKCSPHIIFLGLTWVLWTIS